MLKKHATRKRRQKGIRKNLFGTAVTPRLSVFRSSKFIYAQLIDDVSGVTLVGFSDKEIKTGTPVEKAKQVGIELSKLAKKLSIKSAKFDRGGYKYHGRVKSLAEGAREGGLEF